MSRCAAAAATPAWGRRLARYDPAESSHGSPFAHRSSSTARCTLRSRLPCPPTDPSWCPKSPRPAHRYHPVLPSNPITFNGAVVLDQDRGSTARQRLLYAVVLLDERIHYAEARRLRAVYSPQSCSSPGGAVNVPGGKGPRSPVVDGANVSRSADGAELKLQIRCMPRAPAEQRHTRQPLFLPTPHADQLCPLWTPSTMGSQCRDRISHPRTIWSPGRMPRLARHALPASTPADVPDLLDCAAPTSASRTGLHPVTDSTRVGRRRMRVLPHRRRVASV